jgi:hypothetical protein
MTQKKFNDSLKKAKNWDGKSRPSNKAYDDNYDRIFGQKEIEELDESLKQSIRNKKERIFGTNPIAKAVRTPKFKSQVIKNKKKDSYFDSKSVKEMLDEMD